MRNVLRSVVHAMAALGLLLLCNSTVFADEASDTVQVQYLGGDTELDTVKPGVQFFIDDDLSPKDMPSEMMGMTFTRRPWDTAPVDATIDAPAGSTVYLLIGPRPDAVRPRKAATAAGWTLFGQITLVAPHQQEDVVLIYKQRLTTPIHVKIPGGGINGIIVMTRHLALIRRGQKVEEKVERKVNAPPEIPKPPSVVARNSSPVSGPTTRISNPQVSINSLEVYTTEAGMMLGQTSEVVLTIMRGTNSKLTSISFATPVGHEMTLARDEALRFIRVTYPNWYADSAELSFEDKYVGHDGGSIGAALGTLVLSAIQGFDIDPNVAMTGDISANGKVRAIGGVAAKIRGATASKCTLVAVPADNFDQLVDTVVYSGPATVTDVQIIGIADLNDAIAAVRTDRDADLARAITIFAGIQQNIKAAPNYLHTKIAQDYLKQVLQLAPQHLSAKLLLMVAQDKLPKTLSAGASEYYTFVAVNGMLPILKERAQSDATSQVPSVVVKQGLADLKKLRPLADDSVHPLIDAWSRFIWGISMYQAGNASKETLDTQAQAVDDAMATLQMDQDLMQKMLKEGM